MESLAAVVAEELNVKALEFVDSASELVSYVIKPNYRTLGPEVRQEHAGGRGGCGRAPGRRDRRPVARPAVPVTVDAWTGSEYEFAPDDFVVETHEREGFQVEREGGMAVAISTALSPELVSEGLARELVHHIQNTRKAADFQIDDRIHLRVSGPAEIAEMLAVHGDWVKKETLAVSLEVATDVTEPAAPAGADGAPAPPAPTARS